MSTLAERAEALAVDVSCTDDTLTVVLSDGRVISAPLAWFPRLVDATAKQRREWELIGGGIGVHWEAVDEDISVASLLQPENFMRLPNKRRQPTRERRRAQGSRRGARGWCAALAGKGGQAAASFLTRSDRRLVSAFARSYWSCWLSQLSAVVPKAIDRRTAISGLMPAWQFRMLDRVLRLTPSALAASVTVKPRGCKQSSRSTSPG